MLAEIIVAAALMTSGAAVDTLDVAEVSADRRPGLTSSSPSLRLTRKELERDGFAYLHEAVRTLSGVSVKDYGGIGGLKTVSVRNMGASHTAVCYDGIPVSDAQNGQTDISRFCLENVSGVSVTIGQDDEIFRPARLMSAAGVLHIDGLRPELQRPWEVKAALSAASFGTYRAYLHYAAKASADWTVSADAFCLTTRGSYPFALRNGSETIRGIRSGSDAGSLGCDAGIYGSLGRWGNLTARMNIYSSDRGLPGPVVLYTSNPTERLRDRNALASLRYENRFGSFWRFEAGLNYSRAWNRYTDSSPLYSTPQDDSYLQQEATLSLIAQYSPVQWFRIAVAEDLFCNILDSDIPECPFPRRLSSLTAVSARFDADRFRAVVSLLGTWITERTLTDTAPAPDRMRLSPSMSLGYAFLDDRSLRLRASYRDGYRVPTFNDLYYARVGNLSLRPEKASQFNAGLTWGRSFGLNDELETGVTLDGYFNYVRDKITAIPTMFIWKMRNAGLVHIYGTDMTVTAKYRPAKKIVLSADLGWSYCHAVDVTDPSAKNWGHQIPYTPRHSGNAVLALETPWLTASYIMTAVGRRWALPQNIPSNLLEGYADHSIALSRSFTVRTLNMHLRLEVLNLTDMNYEIIRYYPMAGRSWRLSFKLEI